MGTTTQHLPLEDNHEPRRQPNPPNSVIERLTTLSSQLESAVELLSSLQPQHAAAQSTISALESKVILLETLVRISQAQELVRSSSPVVEQPSIEATHHLERRGSRCHMARQTGVSKEAVAFRVRNRRCIGIWNMSLFDTTGFFMDFILDTRFLLTLRWYTHFICSYRLADRFPSLYRVSITCSILFPLSLFHVSPIASSKQTMYVPHPVGPEINKAAKYILWRFTQANWARLSIYP